MSHKRCCLTRRASLCHYRNFVHFFFVCRSYFPHFLATLISSSRTTQNIIDAESGSLLLAYTALSCYFPFSTQLVAGWEDWENMKISANFTHLDHPFGDNFAHLWCKWLLNGVKIVARWCAILFLRSEQIFEASILEECLILTGVRVELSQWLLWLFIATAGTCWGSRFAIWRVVRRVLIFDIINHRFVAGQVHGGWLALMIVSFTLKMFDFRHRKLFWYS